MRALVAEAWLLASGGLVLIGLLSGADAVVVLGVLLLAAGGVSRLWSRLALEELHYSRRLTHTRVFVDESTQLMLERVGSCKTLLNRDRRTARSDVRRIFSLMPARERIRD